ncbi:MAG: hypothetical protein QXY76_03200 [Nitrososphaeria archaeon]
MVNDLDLSKWKEYEDIITDSLWILSKRRKEIISNSINIEEMKLKVSSDCIYSENNLHFIHGDSQDIIKLIPDSSVDLTLFKKDLINL